MGIASEWTYVGLQAKLSLFKQLSLISKLQDLTDTKRWSKVSARWLTWKGKSGGRRRWGRGSWRALGEDLQADLEHEFLKDPEHQGSPQWVPDEGALQSQLQALPQLLPPLKELQATSPSKAASGMNQDTLKSLVGRLQKTMPTTEERVQVIEQKRRHPFSAHPRTHPSVEWS